MVFSRLDFALLCQNCYIYINDFVPLNKGGFKHLQTDEQSSDQVDFEARSICQQRNLSHVEVLGLIDQIVSIILINNEASITHSLTEKNKTKKERKSRTSTQG